ncbi:MAG: Rpn family recombination-promoting nuclease/putative transposase, partial [Treponema sp.]|nr:Rpn family recombination-promoting nuclease/putative transposase [Treponema sp.]
MNPNANKHYKDSVFSLLFGDPEILRELYGAIEGIDVPKDAIININTLSEALFMKKINDLSFTIDDRIVVLIEHQSTLSQNIPLRILMYIARVYEKIVEEENIYHKKLIKIPTPEFIVLYNGKEE